jgi:hypothetical protein
MLRRFQAHSVFVIFSFDISRLNYNSSKTNVLTRSKSWPATVPLLEPPAAKQLMEAASQAEKYQPMTDPAIRELLKGVIRIRLDMKPVYLDIHTFYGFDLTMS